MKTLLTLTILAFAINATAQIGLPDINFGINGVATVNLVSYDDFYDLKILPNGKILCLSKSGDSGSTNTYPTVCRLNPDGSLDQSYGNNGFVQLPDLVFLANIYFNLAIDNQQRAIVATHVGNDCFVYRLTSDGSLDTDFSFDGKVVVDFSGGNESPRGVEIQPDGKIVVACSVDNGFGTVRLNTDGTFDTSFDTDGKVIHSISGIEEATEMTIQQDGKILICGTVDDGFGNWIAVMRLNTDGSIDNSFSGDGIVTKIINSNDRPYSVVSDSNGKIIVGGRTSQGNFNQSGVLLRYNSDGTEDNSFDTDGFLEVNFSGGADWITSIALQPDGKILTGGFYDINNNDLPVWATRVNVDGTFDPEFSTDGSTSISLSSLDMQTLAVDLSPSGDLILGARDNQTSPDIRLVKLKTGLNIGMNELELKTVSAFPNPATDVLNLNLSEFETGLKAIRIFDNAGKLVFESSTNSNTQQLNISSLTAGTYTCIVSSKTEKALIQFSKN